jgi:HlyD family secretion protein
LRVSAIGAPDAIVTTSPEVLDMTFHTASAIPAPRRRWLRRRALPLAILACTAGVLAIAARDWLLPATEVSVLPVLVESASMAQADAPSGAAIQAAGWIEPDPFAVIVPALADGVVVEVVALEGMAVAAGDIMARLLDEDARLAMRRAEADLARRRGELSEAEAELIAAQARWDHPINLQRDAQMAEAAFREGSQLLHAHEATERSEQLTLDGMRVELARNEELLAKGAVAEPVLARMRLLVEAQEAKVKAAGAETHAARDRVARLETDRAAVRRRLELRIDDRRELDIAKARRDQAAATIAEAEAALDEATLRLRRMTIVAPRDGTVLSRNVQAGQVITRDASGAPPATAFTLYDPRRLQARVDVPLADAGRVRIGDTAVVETEALPGRAFAGEVTRIVHEANLQRNTLQFKVRLLEPDPLLKPEMLVRARFGGSSRDVEGASARVLAPMALLVQADSATFAWVVDGETQRARRIVVTLGAAGPHGLVEVRSGLRPGDRLITSGLDALREGARVRVVDASQEPAS